MLIGAAGFSQSNQARFKSMMLKDIVKSHTSVDMRVRHRKFSLKRYGDKVNKCSCSIISVWGE